MENEEVRRLILQVLQPTLTALDHATQGLEGTEDRINRRMDAHMLVINQLLTERHAAQVNAMAMNDPRFAALVAYVTGGDVGQAFDRSREVFRDRHPGVFDDARWGTEPDWLAALRAR